MPSTVVHDDEAWTDQLDSFRLLVVGLGQCHEKIPEGYLRRTTTRESRFLVSTNLRNSIQWLSDRALASSCAKIGRQERILPGLKGVSGVLLRPVGLLLSGARHNAPLILRNTYTV